MPMDVFRIPGVGDRPKRLYLATQGSVYYFDDIMCVYRTDNMNSFGGTIMRDNKKSKKLLENMHFLSLIGSINIQDLNILMRLNWQNQKSITCITLEKKCIQRLRRHIIIEIQLPKRKESKILLSGELRKRF